MATVFATPGNNVSTTVGSTYTAGDYVSTGMVLATGSHTKFPTLSGGQYYRITVCQVAFAYSPTATTANYTIYKSTGFDGTNLDKLVGMSLLEGTTDRGYAVGDIVEIRVTAGTLSDIHTAVNAIQGTNSGSLQAVVSSGYPLVLAAEYAQPRSMILLTGYDDTTSSVTTSGGTVLSNTYYTSYADNPSAYQTQLTVFHDHDIGQSARYGFRFLIGYPLPLIDAVNGTGAALGNFVIGEPGNNVGVGFNVATAVQADVAANLHVRSGGASNVAQIVQGFASQTGDLTQWKSSAPATLSSVDKNGVMCMVTQSTGAAPAGTTHAGGLIFDTSNFKLWAYTGSAWKSVTLA